MHRNNKIIFVLSVFMLLSCGCMNRDIANMDSRGSNIICFGDSITQGFGADAKYAYPAVLAQMTSAPVINAGIEGDTSDQALKRLYSDVLSKKPLLVIIEFGANDFLTRVPLEKTLRNLRRMIRAIQAKGAMVAIADVSNAVVMNEYSKEFKALSQKYATIYIPDLLRGIITDMSLKSDYFHPNARGYKIVAQRVYRSILPYLNRNAIAKNWKR